MQEKRKKQKQLNYQKKAKKYKMAEKQVKSIIISGKRKTAVAKIRIKPGSGKITYNKLPYTELTLFHRLALAEPIKIYEAVAKFMEVK